jgi:hypothetical protein
MAEPHLIRVLGIDQLVKRVLANRLEQPIARPGVGVEGHDRCLDQPAEQIENLEPGQRLVRTYPFCGIVGEPVGEHRQSA